MLSSVAARAACSVSVVAAIGPSCSFVAELVACDGARAICDVLVDGGWYVNTTEAGGQ